MNNHVVSSELERALRIAKEGLPVIIEVDNGTPSGTARIAQMLKTQYGGDAKRGENGSVYVRAEIDASDLPDIRRISAVRAIGIDAGAYASYQLYRAQRTRS